MFKWDEVVIANPEYVHKNAQRFIISLDDGSNEQNVILNVFVSAHNEDSMRHLILSQGGVTKQTNKLVEPYSLKNGKVINTVVSDFNLWLGLYIQYLELHNVTEESTYDGLKNQIPQKYEQYNSWLNNMSISDRRIRLLNQAEMDTEWDPLYEDILQIGTWRNHSKEKDLKSFSKAIHKNINFDNNSCYKNVRKVLQTDRYWKNNNVKYVEGIALPKNAARIVGHGWIEHNERVVELTWPWHKPIPPKDAIYFGAEVSRDELKSSWNKGGGGPYILNLKYSKIA